MWLTRGRSCPYWDEAKDEAYWGALLNQVAPYQTVHQWNNFWIKRIKDRGFCCNPCDLQSGIRATLLPGACCHAIRFMHHKNHSLVRSVSVSTLNVGLKLKSRLSATHKLGDPIDRPKHFSLVLDTKLESEVNGVERNFGQKNFWAKGGDLNQLFQS